MQEANQGSKPRKQDKRGKRKDKRTKSRANTPQAFKPPNHSRTQKPHKPRKARKPSKPTQTQQTALKTPLECEIEPYLQATHHKQSERAGKGTEHTPKDHGHLRQVLKVLKGPAHSHQWTPPPPPQKRMKAAP